MSVDLTNHFLKYLSQGANSEIEVYDQYGDKLNSEFIDKVLEERVGRSPFIRSEWLEDSFEKREDGL